MNELDTDLKYFFEELEELTTSTSFLDINLKILYN